MPAAPITTFTGRYRFLSNFYPCVVLGPGDVAYPTVEHAYQAAKVLDTTMQERIRQAHTPGAARRLGRRARPIRADWDAIRVGVMRVLLLRKFTAQMGLRLLATGDADLTEGNDWGDTFWGVCKGVGENQLGRLLMEVRAICRQEQENHDA